MIFTRSVLILLFFSAIGFSQTNTYSISFENAVHHEAEVSVVFPEVQQDTLEVRMSRTSPGRYALHEFAKNVYNVRATDSKGNRLTIVRDDPYSWNITGHDGIVKLHYTLFANRADGTYSQIDQTHAHLNIPATFMFSEVYKDRPVEVVFDTENHPNWNIATQLKKIGSNTYFAPDLYYFMDSPTEISDYDMRSFKLNGQEIRFVLHHEDTEASFKEYFDQVKKIVLREKEVFEELPEFDYGTYTFLACYMPQVSGDGMEHRNSTVLTSTTALTEGGMRRNIGTVSHEFFHAWNVERIRPKSLEPFDFTAANMSGALWFAEGFTSYFTDLILARAGLITPEQYVEEVEGTFNYVWNSPARELFNPVEMSYQAPFVDAATSVDPVNRVNTFISYYSYGSMLGLALDLKLRKKDLNLDDFMKRMWEKYGVPEVPYTLEDLHAELQLYAGKKIADNFFENYIFDSGMPDYKSLFASVGIQLKRKNKSAYFGPDLELGEQGLIISSNIVRNTPAYAAGLSRGDEIISVNGDPVTSIDSWREHIEKAAPGDHLELELVRFGKNVHKRVVLQADPTYELNLVKDPAKKIEAARRRWLSGKQ